MYRARMSVRFRVWVAVCAGTCLCSPNTDAGTSRILYPGSDGRLVYVADEKGNRIPDFSHAGYGGGGVELPQVSVVETVSPGDGDDGGRIQAAIDRVSQRSLDGNGLRGAVLLKRGRYQIAGTLSIRTGGVVLRGEGQGDDGTILEATGTDKRTLIEIKPSGSLPKHPEVSGTRQKIVDAYVPVGARTFRVEEPSTFRVGDAVIVHRPSTQAWIAAIEMDQIPPRSDGREITQWAAGSRELRYNRVITAVDGNRITVDAPLFHWLDKTYEQSTLYQYDTQYVIEQVGVEHLRSESAFVGETDEAHAWTLISMNYVQNAWVRQVTAVHYGFSLISTEEQTKWVTVEDCECLDPISQITGGRRYSFDMEGQLHLVQRCYARNGRHDYVVGTTRSSGIVFLDCISEKIHSSNEPHHRYSTGILYDGVKHIDPETKLVLGLWNRLNHGTGHGWAAAFSVLWNCTAPTGGITCEKPPLAQNYAIGCESQWMSSHMRWGQFPGLKGNLVPGEAHWEHWNVGPVTPASLYIAQLDDRLTPVVVLPVLPLEKVDFNSDGQVNFGDFLLFVQGFQLGDLRFDLDEDGQVGFGDFLLFAQAFGT
jgi:hypothetical protein